MLRGFWREALEIDKVVSYADVISPERILAVTPYAEADRLAKEIVERQRGDLSPEL